MNNTNNSKIVLVALSMMLIFGIVTFIPSSVNAGGGYYGYHYYGSPFGTDIDNRYNYGANYTTPVFVKPVYYTQPVYINQPVVVQQPVVVSQVLTQYVPLVASCSANVSYNNSAGVATAVWTVNPSGGNGSYYNYSWSGSDGLSGSSKNVYHNYSTAGIKYASVSIVSGGHTITVNCTPITINFSQPIYYQQTFKPIYNQSNYYTGTMLPNNDLDVGCYVDPTNAKVDQPVTWTVEVAGGLAPYTYSWTGSENLSGTQSSVIKYYGTSGSKSAIVTVNSADGRTLTKACSNTINISNTYQNSNGITKTATKASAGVESSKTDNVNSVKSINTDNDLVNEKKVGMTAASILSLGNVPWGWIAIIIILVLLLTVMYLLFNRRKI